MPEHVLCHSEVPILLYTWLLLMRQFSVYYKLQLSRKVELVPVHLVYWCSLLVWFATASWVVEQSLTGARAAERAGVGLGVRGPYNQAMGLSSLQVGLICLISSSEDSKLALKAEAEEVLYISAGHLGPRSSAFITFSHSRLAETIAANWIWSKRWGLVGRICMLIQVWII